MNQFPITTHPDRELTIKEQLGRNMTWLLACSGNNQYF